MNEILNSKNADAIYIVNEANKRYITNFSGSTSLVVIFNDEKYIITDGRYTVQVKTEVYSDVKVIIKENNKSYFETLIELLNSKSAKKILVEGEHLSYTDALKLQEYFEIEAISNYIEAERLIKTEEEIKKIKMAADITSDTYEYLREIIKPGMTEVEVKTLMEAKQVSLGASGSSFEPIVAFGDNAAKPHAKPTKKELIENDIVTLDFGCFYEGYCSDMTRSFFVGENIDPKLSEIYDIVLKAHQMQVEAIKPGKSCKEIDKLGRDYITEKGYGDKFAHGTGHGIGLEIHEGPTVSAASDTILKPGMVITIEPGIYVEGLGGVRIENDILVTENGYEILNKAEINKYI